MWYNDEQAWESSQKATEIAKRGLVSVDRIGPEKALEAPEKAESGVSSWLGGFLGVFEVVSRRQGAGPRNELGDAWEAGAWGAGSGWEGLRLDV